MQEDNKNIDFDNEIKNLALGVYKENEKYIPKNWIKIAEKDYKVGFHGEVFYKDNVIVLSFRGTNDVLDVMSDIQMAVNLMPSQYVDALELYMQFESMFPNTKFVFTGHSLGGSLAQLLGAETGNEAVTFNAYGVGDLIQKENINDANIRNYGHIDDAVFNCNLENQLGKSYIIPHKNGMEYITKSLNGNYSSKLRVTKYHKIEKMGKLEDAVEYKPNKHLEQNILKGGVFYNVIAKQIDKKRIITREEISKMSKEEFRILENFINQQLKIGNVMAKEKAEEKVKTGELIWVNPYTREDGTEVSGYYRRK